MIKFNKRNILGNLILSQGLGWFIEIELIFKKLLGFWVDDGNVFEIILN